ncbi:MAG: NADH:flavin oxidoreductase [Firmicutes bacterium]|nr:NADH:flavin oxidoreductase [Bacillota bacterium]
MADIHTPIQIGEVLFENRIVMAPMVRFDLTCKNGVMSEKLVNHYVERADKGIGLIVSQVLSVDKDREIAGGAGAYSEEHIDYLSCIASECRKNGTRFFAQLGLPGFAFYDKNTRDVNLLSVKEMEIIRDNFIQAAENCKKAGLDGVELHGAHTFFLNMVSSSISNQRTDDYGGSQEKRFFLAKQIVAGIKEFSGNDFIVSYRMGWCVDEEEDVSTANLLEHMGVDMLHVSSGIPSDRVFNLPENYGYESTVFAASRIKQKTGIPIIAVNRIDTIARGNRLIEDGCCDFAAYGRPLLNDKNFVNIN